MRAPAPAGVLEVLEHERAGALGARRTRRGGRRRAGTRPSLDSAVMLPKAATARSRDHGRLGAAPDGHVAAARWPPAGPRRPRRGCRPRRRWRSVSHGPRQPARIETCGRAGVGHHHGDEEGRHPPRPLLEEHLDLLLSVSRPPTPVAKIDAGPVGVGADLAGVGQGHVGGRHRELGEAVDPPGLLGPEPGGRVEARHPALALRRRAEQAVPEGVEADAAAGHHAEAGDGDPPPRDGPVGPDAEEHQSLAEMRS